MDIIFLMISVSIVIAVIFFVLFIKSVKSGQYDDLYTPSVRMLFEDEFSEKHDKTSDTKSNKNSINLNNNQ
ncbi:MAG: cbb3-type cytochrome oxidase assembly protein CcoS [Flavobacteriaceae bacterium]|nr:cbb3-type cytochrome oxidase assembly protein CcoS [Flavobacteriaceae bacterium]